jgi:hypothetical protein
MTDYSYDSRDTSPYPGNGPAEQQETYAPAPAAAKPTAIQKKPMGFVGFSNLPNQVHRKSVRKGFQFTTMVVGASEFSSQSARLGHPGLTRVFSFSRQVNRVWASLRSSTHSLKLPCMPERLPSSLL